MFLYERLIGVGLYSLALVLVCLALIGKSGKKIRYILFLYSIILCVFAFKYVPYKTADLYRIYGYVESFQKYSFESLLKQQVEKSELGIASILYWAISKTGIPELLPTIISFVCYSCIFYIISKTAEKNQISGKNVAIALFFYMSIGNYMFVISGIRCMLGVSLLSFCFFRESVEKKFNILHIPLYVIAAVVHAFSVVLIAMRFLIVVLDTKTTFVRKLIYCLFLGVGAAFVLIRYSDYIDKVLGKAENYVTNDGYSYVWEYVIAILACIVMICVFLKRNRIKQASSIKLNVWIAYEIALFLVALCFCYEFTIFHRLTTYIMPIIALPMLMTVLQSNDNMRSENAVSFGSVRDIPLGFNAFVVTMSALILLIACSRGTLSSLKFFVW